MMDVVSGIRGAIQDLLVPELKAIQKELELEGARLDRLEAKVETGLSTLGSRIEAGLDGLEGKLGARLNALEAKVETQGQALAAVSGKLDLMIAQGAQASEKLAAQGQALASLSGKLDLMIGLLSDYRDAIRLVGRVDALQADVAELKRRSA